ncbi:GyrI-like domain-containing protein [Legionella shakespearei]|uniref:Transcription activator n=1 Tax=Legionella shakespearei DSM 23087 TaxID=1122169 RepID=A0A0W0Z820_9GAMM|nr:GyrI-like domain-containing protein [Legionella shakespearei]KTD65070.1 transcription activator [Legionella shakespearei DSM 23087]
MNSEPKLIPIDGLTVAGFSVRTMNKDEFKPETAKLPELWGRFASSGLMKGQTAVYGVYSDYESDASGFYTVTAGIPLSSSLDGEYETVSILPGHYLVFSDKGPMPQTVVQIWERVWNYFTENKGYKRNFFSDFELYTSEEDVAVYIGIITS